MSYQSQKPRVNPPTDAIMTSYIATAPSGLASNPELPMSYPLGHAYSIYSGAIPARTSSTPSVTSSPNTNAPATVSTSEIMAMMYPFPQVSYPFGPVVYGKPMPYGYPWTFHAKVSVPPPTTSAPTTKPATAPQTFATTSTTVASNPQPSGCPFKQIYYPFGPMMYHHKPMPYGYPWVFPAKAPTTTPTTTVPTTTTATTSQMTATPSSIVANNPQESVYSFNPMYYPYGPMPSHRKPMP